MNFIKNNKLFSVLYLIAVVITIGVVYKIGFREASIQSASQLERLKNITFPIWDQYTFSEHGFLVFYSIENYEKKIAYSNHSSIYLFYMYLLYKIEILLPSLQMRMTGAFINICSLALVSFFFLTRQLKVNLNFGQSLLILLATIFMVSTPGFWISSSRFNVDNPFPLIFFLHAITAFIISRVNKSTLATNSMIIVFSIFSPISAVLLGFSLLIWSCRNNELNIQIIRLALLAVIAGIIFYLPSPIISKLLGFTSSNSGWFFRAGLDGDTSYFNNVINSIVDPYYSRPFIPILLPLSLLLAQFVVLKVKSTVFQNPSQNISVSKIESSNFFYYLLFSQYLYCCLFWPQAVSIHPYLYDYLLLAPVFILIILNFSSELFKSTFVYWIIVLLFLISFNFQQVAQAKCNGCFYPSSWGIKKQNQ
jgi:hypothetical protein